MQTCEQTLQLARGSCRDTGWLLVQILRHLGLAARFCSGYLVQLAPDVKALDGPSGPSEDFTDLHAWCEVYLPGAGWVGLDPTSGLFAGESHIPLACTPSPISAAPITGSTDECEVEFNFVNEVMRIHEDPRVTKPYSAEQWTAIQALGDAVDVEFEAGDVRLTMGGEPTFVSVDDMDSAQWNVDALGEHKLKLAKDLLIRLRNRFVVSGRGDPALGTGLFLARRWRAPVAAAATTGPGGWELWSRTGRRTPFHAPAGSTAGNQRAVRAPGLRGHTLLPVAGAAGAGGPGPAAGESQR